MTLAGSLVWCSWIPSLGAGALPDFQDQVLFFFPGEERCSLILDPQGGTELFGPNPIYPFDATSWFPTHDMVRAEEWL